ncbi:MAG: 23S rRNA (guanosine(2251)-2'-O)-methyltransferase RlmB [Acholeplasmataceae bacterium]|nr:23S rRNA (guanosine(2251)-2'-O)-methyltransferase RlmB [Acholeplasmataceae bacterium]
MIVYGKNVIKEAIFTDRPIYKIYIDERFSDHHFLKFLKDKQLDYVKVSKGELNRMTQNAVHQGIVADLKAYDYFNLEDVIDASKVQRFLILDGIEDPHNLGAIMRTAEAVQLDGIIISKKGQVLLNATVAKVSSGAIEHVPVILVSNINQTILKLKEHNIWVIGTDGTTDKTYDDMPLELSIAIVLGNEGEGIRPLVKQNCDMLVKIPMFGKINSLNVSVAAALMMYKAIK